MQRRVIKFFEDEQRIMYQAQASLSHPKKAGTSPAKTKSANKPPMNTVPAGIPPLESHPATLLIKKKDDDKESIG